MEKAGVKLNTFINRYSQDLRPLEPTAVQTSQMTNLIRGTIGHADLGFALRGGIRSTRVYVRGEKVRGYGTGGNLVTVSEAERYIRAEAEVTLMQPQLTFISLLEQRAELLRREVLAKALQLWPISPASVPLESVIGAGMDVKYWLHYLAPSRVGLLVDDKDRYDRDIDPLTVRLKRALIVNETDLTLTRSKGLAPVVDYENGVVAEDPRVTELKEQILHLVTDSQLNLWGRVEDFGFMEMATDLAGHNWEYQRPPQAYFYQVADVTSFKPVLMRALKAGRDLEKMINRAKG